MTDLPVSAPPPPDLPPPSFMNPLEKRIQYKFRNSLLLAEALTHPSLGHETQRHHFDNQRLEFLGDAVLQLIFTEHLFSRFPTLPEGHLTKMRSRLVSREGLKVHAIAIGIGEYLMMGRGEESSGGRLRASALADAFEALIGAMFLDSDIDTVRQFVLREAEPDIQNLQHEPMHVNPKGRLQEILQALSPRSPVYTVVSQSGPEHQKHFESVVSWNNIELGRGTGTSKKEAEVEAAINALTTRCWEADNLGDNSAKTGNNRD
ncbi:MAG: ribonuclease III [Chthoniobacteraceae bacterium]|nr:ribonuclease III [Chthoniobacteraceae bacterium]